MSNTVTFIASGQTDDGVVVKISLQGLDYLGKKRLSAIALVNSIFDTYQANNTQKATSGDIVSPREIKPKKTMIPISSADFIQACFSCLDEQEKSVHRLDLFNPTFNKLLPNGYGVSDHVTNEQSDIVFLNFRAKVSLLQDQRRFQYDPDTESFSLRVEE